MLKQNDASARRFLAALTDGVAVPPGPLDGAKVRLFSNDYSPGPDSVLADFTEADFDGYAESAAIVWGAPITTSDARSEITGDTKQFNCSGNTTPNTIYGYMVVDSDDPALVLWAERFDDPVNVVGVGDGVIVIPRYTLWGQI